MKKIYATMVISFAFLCISSCASKIEPKKLYLNVKYISPPDDLGLYKNQSAEYKTEYKSNLIILFPIGTSRKCNENKQNCKLAIISTKIKIEKVIHHKNNFTIIGVLHSEMGRTVTKKSENSELVNSLPSDIAIIGEGVSDIPFEKILNYGEVAVIYGLQGVEVEVSASF